MMLGDEVFQGTEPLLPNYAPLNDGQQGVVGNYLAAHALIQNSASGLIHLCNRRDVNY